MLKKYQFCIRYGCCDEFLKIKNLNFDYYQLYEWVLKEQKIKEQTH